MATLFFLFASIYLMTYNARQVVNDELQALDAVTSLARFGDFRYDESVWYVWENYGPLSREAGLYPLPRSPFEQGIVWASQPLYVLSQAIPQVGVVHVVMLLNVFIGAAACVLMFQYARLLGYNEAVGIGAALLLGLGTVLWPYSRTFLREPLTLLLLLLTAFFLELSRHRRPPLYFLGAILVFLGAFLVKETILFALVGLPVILLREQDLRRRWLDALFIVGCVIVVVLAFTDVFSRIITENAALVGEFRLQPAFFQEAFHAYLFSPGGSIWGVSPVLLLAIPGTWMLIRSGQRRYVWLMVLCVVGYAFAHAATTGRHWFGGAVWPSRFLIPMIPFMLIPALPALDAVLNRRANRWAIAGFGMLVVYALWWQVIGASVWLFEYGDALPPEAGGLGEWRPGLNHLQYLRPVVLTPIALEGMLDFAWLRMDVIWWPILFAGVAVASAVLLWRLNDLHKRRYPFGLLLIAFVFGLGTIGGLQAIYEDPNYLGDSEPLHEVLAYLDEHEQPGDVLVLNAPIYANFFLNYSNFDDLRVVSLPVQPGAVNTTGQQPQATSSQLPNMLDPATPPLLNALAAERSRLWLLMDTGPLIPGNRRPVELSLLGSNYWLKRVQLPSADERVRLLEFATARAPNLGTPPEISTDLLFNENVALDGVTLPPGISYRAGENLPVTLHFRAVQPESTIYRVAVFLVDEQGRVVAQGHDSRMLGGFLPDNAWLNGESIMDNRALALPDELPPGSYRLWVRLYDFNNAGQLQTAAVTGSDTIIDGDIGVLPVNITITE